MQTERVTDEMVERTKTAWNSISDKHNGWDALSQDERDTYTALVAALSSAEEKAVEVTELDARMKAAGMYTIAEMMGVTPLAKWKSNPAINTIEAFSAWLDRKVTEYLRMKSGYDLGDKGEDDELYEWVLAHVAVFSAVRDQFQVVRSALLDAPVAQEPAAKPDRWQDKEAAEREFTEDFARNYRGPDTGDNGEGPATDTSGDPS